MRAAGSACPGDVAGVVAVPYTGTAHVRVPVVASLAGVAVVDGSAAA